MKEFRFRKFQVYKDARELRKFIKQLSKEKFPKEEQFCLIQQLWRAMDSIILNIAEGCNRGTDKDFARYINFSHTSLDEVIACLDCAHDDKYINDIEHGECLSKGEIIAKQLTAFRKSLLESPTK